MLFFLLFLAFWTLPSLSRVNITLNGQPFANSSATATWYRDPSDPLPHSVFKVKEDEVNTTSGEPISLTSDSIKLKLGKKQKHLTNATEGLLTGNVTIYFNRAGIFHLVVRDDDHNELAKSATFGVNAPKNLQFKSNIVDPDPANDNQGSNSAPSSPSSPSKNGNSTASTNSSDDGGGGDGDSSHSDKKSGKKKGQMSQGLIAATVLVSLVLLGCLVGILYYFIRKRLLRQRYLRERQAMQSSFAPSMMVGRSFGRVVTSDTTGPIHQNVVVHDLEREAGFSDTESSIRRYSIFSGSQFSDFPSNAATEDAGPKRRRSFPSIMTSGTVSTMRFTSQTERQIMLEERIWELEAEMDKIRNEQKAQGDDGASGVSDDDLRLWKLKGQIESLRTFKESQWALGLTEEVPAGLSLR